MAQKINLTRQQKIDVVRLVKEYEYQNEKHDLENLKDDLEKEIIQIQLEVQQLHAERKKVESENSKVIEENNDLKKNVDRLKRKLAKAKSDRSIIQIQKINLYNEKDRAESERENLIQQREMLMSLFDVITTSKNSRFGEEEEEEESHESNGDSEIYQQVQRLNQEVTDRCNEISNLKSLLDNSTNLIKKLQSERNEILKTINSPSKTDKNKKTQKKKNLNKNLDDLATSIIEQNEAISIAMSEKPKEVEPLSNSSLSNSGIKRNTPQSPRQQSGLQVTYVITKLQKQVNELTEENAKLQSLLDDAEEERETIFMSLGISKYNTEKDDQDETSKLDKQSNAINKAIQRLKDDLSQRIDEVANLKQLLADSTNTIVQLTKEHDEIAQLFEQQQQDEEECSYSSNQTILLENLDELGSQIDNQNDSMNQEIANSPVSERDVVISPSKRERSPFKRPQTTIADSLKKIQNELKEATLLNIEKDNRIEELEAKINQLTDEHRSIMQALYGASSTNEEVNDANDSELIDNLNTLNSSINQQNKTINSAIIEGGRSLRNESKTIRPTHLSRRNRIQRSQNHTISALTQIRKELTEATEAIFDKDAKIEELEAQISKLQSENHVTERSINIDPNQNLQIKELTQKIDELEKQKKASTQKIQQLSNEVQQLKSNINKISSSLKKANQLLGNNNKKGGNDDDVISLAENLESQLLNFITKSAKEQSNSSTGLEKKVDELNDRINQLQEECKSLNLEKNAVLSVLGVNDEDSDQANEEFLLKTESPLFKQVQTMTQTVQDQLGQINELKRHLLSAARTIQQLSSERNSFMQALMPEEASFQADSATKTLFRNLEALGLQISRQNDDINSAMEEEVTLSSASVQRSPRRERERLQKPQNYVLSALNKIRSQLESAQKEVSAKEVKIAELEKKIDKISRKSAK